MKEQACIYTRQGAAAVTNDGRKWSPCRCAGVTGTARCSSVVPSFPPDGTSRLYPRRCSGCLPTRGVSTRPVPGRWSLRCLGRWSLRCPLWHRRRVGKRAGPGPIWRAVPAAPLGRCASCARPRQRTRPCGLSKRTFQDRRHASANTSGEDPCVTVATCGGCHCRRHGWPPRALCQPPPLHCPRRTMAPVVRAHNGPSARAAAGAVLQPTLGRRWRAVRGPTGAGRHCAGSSPGSSSSEHLSRTARPLR